MHLTVRKAAALLKLPETEIFRLIKQNDIPHLQLNNSWYFNKTELLEWAIARGIPISPDFLSDLTVPSAQLPALCEALATGGVHRLSIAPSKEDLLRTVVTLIKGITPAESKIIYNALMARETLGSTAIGNGIAIPHVRNPIILNISGPSIILCFLDQPIDFGAVDGKKVSTIFTMISQSARVHLHLLARLSYLLQNDTIRAMLTPSAKPEKILAVIRDAEKNLPIHVESGTKRTPQ